MKKEPQYLSISQLAEYFDMSTKQARQLAKSRYLRNRKGAVINVNMSGGKYEVLKVNVNDAKEVFAAVFG